MVIGINHYVSVDMYLSQWSWILTTEVVRPCEENERGAHSEKNALDIPGERIRGQPNLRWKDACKRDMTEAGLREDKKTNRAAWRNTIISYTGDPR